MKKRIAILAVALLLMSVLSACGNGGGSKATASPMPTTAPTTAATTAPTATTVPEASASPLIGSEGEDKGEGEDMAPDTDRGDADIPVGDENGADDTGANGGNTGVVG